MQINRLKIKNIKPLVFLILSIASVLSCIEEFNPGINESGKYLVIAGSVIKGDSLQVVNISYTKPFNETSYGTVSGCEVWVEDNNGNRFDFMDTGDGKYVSAIPEEYLTYNAMFRLRVNTENGGEYQSDFEPILESSEVDTIYPLIESFQSSSVFYGTGYQFYIDLKAIEGGAINYKWTITETYEYRSTYPLYGYWYPSPDTTLDTIIKIPPEQVDSLHFCYSTNNVAGIYTASTENLTVNQKKKIPLNYVPGDDYRIKHKYSILVKQYALSDAAYEYWYANKVELSESGGLYQSQPSQTKSNIYNMNDPDELVVGFFWASSYTEGRVFVSRPLLTVNEPTSCPFDTIYSFDNYWEYPRSEYLLTGKINQAGDTTWGTSYKECIDCRLRGGTTTIPDYW